MPPTLKAIFALAARQKYPAVVSTLLTVMTLVIFMMLSQWLIGSLEATGGMQPPPSSASASD
jgi:hypothetical protein